MKKGSGEADPARLIVDALGKGRRALSEYASKKLVSAYGVPVVDEWLCVDAEAAAARAAEAGWPAVLKLCSPDVVHKKEKGFVAVGLPGRDSLIEAARRMMKGAEGIEIEGFLVQRMVRGERELLAGMRRDPVFGVCVTLGLGGIFTEALGDVSVRVAPVSEADAAEMLDDLNTSRIFGAYRGLAPVDRGMLAKTIIGLGEIGLRHPEVREIDVNPLIVNGSGHPVAVDALVILSGGGDV